MTPANLQNPVRNSRGLPLDPLIYQLDVTASYSKYKASQLTNKLRLLDSSLRAAYVDTHYCSDTLIESSNGKIKTLRCRRPWCRTCLDLRSKNLYRGYESALNALPDKQLVTLTIPAVSYATLPASIERMQREFRRIQDKVLKRRRVVGIRKLEVSYNLFTDQFTPHYHLIISSAQSAENLIGEWLKTYPEARCSAQNVKPVQRVTPHLFSYFSKMLTGKTACPLAMDAIFRATKDLGVGNLSAFASKKPLHTTTNQRAWKLCGGGTRVLEIGLTNLQAKP